MTGSRFITARPWHRAAVLPAAILAVVSIQLESGAATRQQPSERWITAWGASQNGLGVTAITNATVRMIARVTISGNAVRIRLDNTYGTSPLTIGRAYVGQRIQGAALATGSNRQVHFNHSPAVTIPAGGSVQSDPVAIKVLARTDLAVSVYIPEANVRPSQHGGAQVTSFMTASGSGDLTGQAWVVSPRAIWCRLSCPERDRS